MGARQTRGSVIIRSEHKDGHIALAHSHPRASPSPTTNSFRTHSSHTLSISAVRREAYDPGKQAPAPRLVVPPPTRYSLTRSFLGALFSLSLSLSLSWGGKPSVVQGPPCAPAPLCAVESTSPQTKRSFCAHAFFGFSPGEGRAGGGEGRGSQRAAAHPPNTHAPWRT